MLWGKLKDHNHNGASGHFNSNNNNNNIAYLHS